MLLFSLRQKRTHIVVQKLCSLCATTAKPCHLEDSEGSNTPYFSVEILRALSMTREDIRHSFLYKTYILLSD